MRSKKYDLLSFLPDSTSQMENRKYSKDILILITYLGQSGVLKIKRNLTKTHLGILSYIYGSNLLMYFNSKQIPTQVSLQYALLLHLLIFFFYNVKHFGGSPPFSGSTLVPKFLNINLWQHWIEGGWEFKTMGIIRGGKRDTKITRIIT